MGIWVESDSYVPSPGDYIFYDWDDNGIGDNRGDSDHVGIVEKVSDGLIYVIEGNYSNAVKRRTLAVNGRYIRGYGVPKYDTETQVNKSIDELARAVIAGEYGNGDERKEKLGYLYDEVQDRVNELLSPVTPKTEHTVVRGDTLWGIAEKYLGSGHRYPEIVDLNQLDTLIIQIGQKLKIPTK